MDLEEIKKSLLLRDRSVRVISDSGLFRAVCVKNTTTAQTAAKNFNLKGQPAALLAKALTGASAAASFLKGEERVVLELDSSGPVSKIFAEAMQLGEVRGFLDFKNPGSVIHSDGNNDIVGIGLLRLTKILYNKNEPFVGVVPIQKGNITDDLEYYFTQSEQIPSFVSLNCDLNSEGDIVQSGGLVIHAMPGYSVKEFSEIIEKIKNSKSVTQYFAEELNPQQTMKEILPFSFEVLNSTQVDFFCRCSKDNFLGKLLTLGKPEIDAMQQSGQNELVCRYCNKHYYLTESDYESLRHELLAKIN